MTLFEYDQNEDVNLLCGVDEAGRGPLAGDVYAAAVILPRNTVIEGLNDSKKLTPKKREQFYDIIKEQAVSYCVAAASVEEIEQMNILQATFLAMRRAVEGLSVKPKLVLIDGNQNPNLGVHSRCVIKGDATSACIAAASVLAKVERDRYMETLDKKYPQYQFAKHKGYGTKLHYQMIDQYGVSPVHRMSFLKKHFCREKAKTKTGETGGLGEKIAAEYLISKGYDIVDRNYHSLYGEIDILAQKENVFVFAEVKTRHEGSIGEAKEAVSSSKRQKLLNTALCYLQEHKINKQPRFDVIEVYLLKGKPNVQSVEHIENAFDGGELYARI